MHSQDSKNIESPPKLLLRFFRWYCHPDYQEDIEGDLTERFERRVGEDGVKKARWEFCKDVIRLFRPGIIKPIKGNDPQNYFGMYENYFKIAWRNSLKNKAYSLINILSVAVGMGVCLMIYQYIHFESSYDNFHGHIQNTYRIYTDVVAHGVHTAMAKTGYSIGVKAKEEIPEIKEYVRIHQQIGGAIVTNPDENQPFYEPAHNILYVDPSFLEVFDFPLKYGSKESVLEDKFNIVITERTAKKYFGADNPVGKVLNIGGGGASVNFTVTGVLEDPPINSHLQFGFLLPMDHLLEFFVFGMYMKEDGWKRFNFATYVTIHESSNPDWVREKLDQLIIKYKGEWMTHENVVEKAGLQPVADIHLKSSEFYSDMSMNNGNIEDVRVFSMIAFFILFIAWVNYINLSTARSMSRAKEVGVRKSIGAFREQLISQFIAESFLINLISAVLSIAIAFFSLPILNNILGKELELSVMENPIFWVWFSIVIILGSLLTGLYPAFVLSSFKPVSMLGSNKPAKAGGFSLRRGLITFQFLISLFLISSTYLVYKQITFMENQELGMDIEKTLVMRGPEIIQDRSNLQSVLQAFKEEVARHHSIAAVAASNSVPGKGHNGEIHIRKLGDPASADKSGRIIFAGSDFPKTYNLEFVAGKPPTQQDLSNGEGVVVINEEAVRMFGLNSPENAIQEKLYFKEDTFRIAGVVKNIHWHSLRDAHKPYILEFYEDCRSYFSFKINSSNLRESLAHIESTYNSFFPGNPFDYFLLEDEFNRQYQSDVQFRNLFFAFTVLAIFIACIGLFALVSYSATLRIKEIGIRKVLGATTTNLMMLLSREYLILISIAIVLAIPAILYWGGAWLENYAFRIDIGFDLFIIPALVLVLISVLTVSHRTYSAANANPVDSLKNE